MPRKVKQHNVCKGEAVPRAWYGITMARMAAILINGLGRRERHLKRLMDFKSRRNILDKDKGKIKNKVRLRMLK